MFRNVPLAQQFCGQEDVCSMGVSYVKYAKMPVMVLVNLLVVADRFAAVTTYAMLKKLVIIITNSEVQGE